MNNKLESKPNWEKEFDEKFTCNCGGHRQNIDRHLVHGDYASTSKLKSFISSLIQSERDRVIKITEEAQAELSKDSTDLCANSQLFKNKVIDKFNRILDLINQ